MDIVQELKKVRIPYSTEAEMQLAIEAFLTSKTIPFRREWKLTIHDRIDFLLDDGTGIECKVKGPALRVFRQVERYCQAKAIKHLILFTSFHMDLPPEINGVKTTVIKPGGAWL